MSDGTYIICNLTWKSTLRVGGTSSSCPEKVLVRFPLVSQPSGQGHTTLADQAHRKLNQRHEYRNAFLLKCHLTSSIKHSATSGFDQSYVTEGSGLENT